MSIHFPSSNHQLLSGNPSIAPIIPCNYPSIHLSRIHLSVHLFNIIASIHVYFHPAVQDSMHLPIKCAHPSECPSICPSIYSFLSESIHPSVHPSKYPSSYPSSSIHPPLYPFISPSIHRFTFNPSVCPSILVYIHPSTIHL